MSLRAVLLAATFLLAPLAARAADLVVWWEKGFYPAEDQAVREMIAEFEQKTGKTVELAVYPIVEIQDKAQAALEGGGQPPDFLWGTFGARMIPRWAYEDRLVDLTDTLAPFKDLFDTDTLQEATLHNARAGRRSLYALPMGRNSNHVHVWKSLLEQAGYKLTDIPAEWGAFWAFWCDQVQPAVRRALGREDIWAVGLPMSEAGLDTFDQLVQFQHAYDASWLGRDGRLRVDDPAVRAGMVRALEAYTTVWRKGCTPPDSLTWGNIDNNKAFVAQRVVITVNSSLSIPGALRTARPDDYRTNAAIIDWPNDVFGRVLVLEGGISRAVVFKDGRNNTLAEEFVRFLVEDGWIAHYWTATGDRYLPPMRKLIDQPFWLDTSDMHRLRSAVQLLSRPHQVAGAVQGNEWRSGRIWQENIWGRAVHRVAADGLTPEQAVGEAIARIERILSE